MTSIIYSFLRITLALAFLLTLLVLFLEKYLVYPGVFRKNSVPLSEIKKLPNLEIWKRNLNKDEYVEAIFLRTPTPTKGTVLFAHGNGEFIDDWIGDLGVHYGKLGFNVLLVEYRGYGRSGGKPSQKNIVDDFAYFYDQLIEKQGPQERIVFHGRSLGGGVVGELIKQRPATHLILEATFTRLTDIAFEKFLAPSFLISNKYLTIENLKKDNTPTLIIHGTKDTIIPVKHGKRLFESISHEKKSIFTMESNHNQPPPEPEKYWDAIKEFLAKEW